MKVRAFAKRIYELLFAFFTTPTTGASASLFRIAFGALSVWTALGVGANLDRYWSGNGGLPWKVMERATSAHWSLIAIAPYDDRLLFGVFLLFLVPSITLLLGAFSRTSALLVWIANVSLQNRNPYVVNGGDRLFLILALLCVLLPLDTRWSLRAWWRARRGKPRLPGGSAWSVRLVQLQVAYLYLSTGLVKVDHPRWLGGLAMRDVLSSPVYNEWPTYIDFWPLVYFLTYFTLAFEVFAFPFLVWLPRTRRFVLWWGVLFHLGIEVLMVIPMFSVIMVVTYFLFLTDEECERLVAWVGRPFGRKRELPVAPPPPEPAASPAPSG